MSLSNHVEIYGFHFKYNVDFQKFAEGLVFCTM